MSRRLVPWSLGLLLIAGTSDVVTATSRYEPPDGKIILMVGQTQEDTQAYLDAAKILPAGLMGYTAIHGEGLQSPYKRGAGTQYVQKLSSEHPDTVLQIGLYLVESYDAIAHGEMDAPVDRLGEWIRHIHRPVFLRLGYEFDSPDNHYQDVLYIQAYRRIVDRFRMHGVTNVAFVWHSYASVGSQKLAAWYPGDDYVDWVGISYFNQPQHYMQPVVQFAHDHGKPVMICESSAATFKTQYANSWNLWFVPFFKFIASNDIKAVCYISCDWDAWPQFKNLNWGETRLQTNPEILRHWLDETENDRYLKSSPDLFKLLGYLENPA